MTHQSGRPSSDCEPRPPALPRVWAPRSAPRMGLHSLPEPRSRVSSNLLLVFSLSLAVSQGHLCGHPSHLSSLGYPSEGTGDCGYILAVSPSLRLGHLSPPVGGDPSTRAPPLQLLLPPRAPAPVSRGPSLSPSNRMNRIFFELASFLPWLVSSPPHTLVPLCLGLCRSLSWAPGCLPTPGGAGGCQLPLWKQARCRRVASAPGVPVHTNLCFRLPGSLGCAPSPQGSVSGACPPATWFCRAPTHECSPSAGLCLVSWS